MSIDRAGLFAALDAAPCSDGRWVVAGSGPLLAMGMIDSIEDIDIVAGSRAWAAVSEATAEPAEVGPHGDRRISLHIDGVDFEIFDGWLGADAEDIIAEAIEIDGHRFMPLERVLESKRRLSRPKDQAHIAILEDHLEQRPTADGR